MSKLSDELTVASVKWALGRMVVLRKAGEKSSFRVVWIERAGRLEYRLEIRRETGEIERPLWPFPLGDAESVEESGKVEGEDRARRAMSVGLDVDETVSEMFTLVGVILAALEVARSGDEMMDKTRAELWRLIPFLKALAALGGEHQERLRELWLVFLRQPMPYGEPPIGVPGEEPTDG